MSTRASVGRYARALFDVALQEGTLDQAWEAARQANVDVPLIEAVNLLLGGRVSIEKIVAGLMSRPLKREN